jgi:cell shape-determining protein MreC
MERVRRPSVVLALALGGCAVLLTLPERWRAALKSYAADGLRPAQVAVSDARVAAARWVGVAGRRFRAAGEAAQLQAEIERLREENRRLASQLAALRVEAEPPAAATGSLLKPRAVEARVLGRQAMAWLGRAQVLDVGRTSGAENGSLVLTSANSLVIDGGADRRLQPGQLALGENCVWGRVAEVGRYASLVRGVLDVGYRDLVQIVGQKAAARGLRRGPQGVLEGTGGTQAKISRVEVAEPVEVGDLVYTAAELGLLARPALYGHVVRVERPVGAACWEIWMEPTVGRRVPERLSVLTAEVNPARMATSPAASPEQKR